MRARIPIGQELEKQLMMPVVRQRIWRGLGISAGLTILFLASEPVLRLLRERELALAWLQSFGVMAAPAYVALYAVQVLVSPIPGSVVSLAGGYLFGPVAGVVYSLVGLALGAGLAATFARHLGRPLIERFAGVQAVSEWERRLRIHSPITWALVFLFPTPDVLFYVAGLAGIPVRRLVLSVFIGRAPGLIVVNWLGARADALSPTVWIGLAALLAAAAFVLYRHERQVRLIGLLVHRRVRTCRVSRVRTGRRISGRPGDHAI